MLFVLAQIKQHPDISFHKAIQLNQKLCNKSCVDNRLSSLTARETKMALLHSAVVADAVNFFVGGDADEFIE